MKKHIDSNCKENIAKEKKTDDINNDTTTEQREPKLQKMGIEEVEQLKKEGKDLTYITGKNKKYIIINKLF
jgi:hypothetical protein